MRERSETVYHGYCEVLDEVGIHSRPVVYLAVLQTLRVLFVLRRINSYARVAVVLLVPVGLRSPGGRGAGNLTLIFLTGRIAVPGTERPRWPLICCIRPQYLALRGPWNPLLRDRGEDLNV